MQSSAVWSLPGAKGVSQVPSGDSNSAKKAETLCPSSLVQTAPSSCPRLVSSETSTFMLTPVTAFLGQSCSHSWHRHISRRGECSA